MKRLGMLLCLALVAGAALVFNFASGAVDAGTEACPGDGGCDGVRINLQAHAAQQLAERYAPIVYLQQQKQACDGREYPPIDVEMLFGTPGHVLRQDVPGQPIVVDQPSAADLFGRGPDYYLDFPGDPVRPGCVYEDNFREHSQGYANVAYAHITTEEGHEGIALQYWMYYYFNQWNNNHEGDWEMIQLNFDASTVEEALQREPVNVGYSQHGGGERAEWGSSKMTIEEGRPVSFVAAGAQANMFSPRNYLGRAEERGVGFGCDDATPPHTRLPLEARLLISDPQSPDDHYPWLSFEGRWGELSRLSTFSGPTGPNMKFSWDHPFSWYEERLRDHNVSVPTGRTAGPGPVNFFCGALAWGSSRVLWVFYAWPILLPVFALAFVAGAGFAATRTDFGYVAPPLRRRRSFGQILRTSWRIYTNDAVTFLGLALLMLPAGLLASGIHDLVVTNPPVENINAVVEAPRVLMLLEGAFLGSAVFGLVYLVVLCGITAALVDVEAGVRPSVSSAAARVWKHAGHLAWARLKATLIVALLAISLIGIPWAIQRGIRWTFLEQAQLIDRADAAGAPGRSGDMVRGRWFQTFARMALLLGIGLVTAPMLSIPLLFIVVLPLSLVNLFSSLIYVILMPFISIAIALTYYDLVAEKGEAREPAGDDECGDAIQGAR